MPYLGINSNASVRETDGMTLKFVVNRDKPLRKCSSEVCSAWDRAARESEAGTGGKCMHGSRDFGCFHQKWMQQLTMGLA
jgi:hypothetical protein